MQSARAGKDIPGEEENDFFYHLVPGIRYHDQEASIGDGMKSEARAF